MFHIKTFISSVSFLLLFPLYNGLFAQVNFYKFTTGFGYGATLPYSETNPQINGAFYADLRFNLTPFSSFGAEFQQGALKGGERGAEAYWFTANYKLLTLNGRLQFGELLSTSALEKPFLRLIKGLYMGAGIGVMENKGMHNLAIAALPEPDRKVSPFSNKLILVPLNVGYSYALKNKWDYNRYILNVNVQRSFALDEGVAGKVNFYQTFTDLYSYISIGVKYHFGPLGLYQKR
jgi:hypothetical protein